MCIPIFPTKQSRLTREPNDAIQGMNEIFSAINLCSSGFWAGNRPANYRLSLAQRGYRLRHSQEQRERAYGNPFSSQRRSLQFRLP